MSKKVIGIDYGTLSARAVILDCNNGKICGSSTYIYPHGVIEDQLPKGYALASSKDYRDALEYIIKNSIIEGNVDKNDIVGIGIDTTTYTLVPCDKQAKVMCEHKKYENEPMAHIKLWKHHGAIRQAQKIQEVHEKTNGFPALARYGGKVNCEWALPKILEIKELAPKLFDDIYKLCDLGEWITFLLTGNFTNSLYTLGFKAMWAEDLGTPTKQALDMLADNFAKQLDEKLWGEPCSHFNKCGNLTKQAAEKLGLNEGIAVASSIGDGTVPGIYYCNKDPKTLAITYGTSIAMSFLSKNLHEITGINGVVKNGIVEGYYGYDTGQPCAGDMLDWYTKSVKQDHAELTKLAIKNNPWENSLTVLDWWNGNRGILNNLSLTGSIIGYTMSTKNEDVYCAMLQGIACGNRKIINHLENSGIKFSKIIILGGISRKNKFAMEQYSNILQREVYISQEDDLTAKSSAVLGAFAAGFSKDQIFTKMIKENYEIIKPDTKHAKEYQEIYSRWCKYHDVLSKIQ